MNQEAKGAWAPWHSGTRKPKRPLLAEGPFTERVHHGRNIFLSWTTSCRRGRKRCFSHHLRYGFVVKPGAHPRKDQANPDILDFPCAPALALTRAPIVAGAGWQDKLQLSWSMAENIPDLVWPKFVQAVQVHDAPAFLDCLAQGIDVNAPLTPTQSTALCVLLHDWLDNDDRSDMSGLEQCLLALAGHQACRWEGELAFWTSTGLVSHFLTVPEALGLPAMRWLNDYKTSLERGEQLAKALAPTLGRQENKPRF